MAGVRNLFRSDVLAHGLIRLRNLALGTRQRRIGNANGPVLRSLQQIPVWPLIAGALCRIAVSRQSSSFAVWVSSFATPFVPPGQEGRSDATMSSIRARWAWEYARLLAWQDTAMLPAGESRAIRARRVDVLRLALRSPVANIRLHASIALSRALFDTGEFGEALAVAEAALRIAPDHAQALRAKAYALVAHNGFGEARALLHRLQEREPENHELRRRSQALEKLPEGPACSPSSNIRAEAPLLIGIGGGIGDILHATPMIRNLARRMGRPVDVLVMPDHAEAEFLVRNPEFVSRGFALSNEVLDRRYDTVFLTHGFGPLRFRFNTGRVLASCEWAAFRPGSVQETLFHLEAAKHLLGIGYDMADVDRYFVADFLYTPPSEPLIGIHAGSKAGRWLSKRWPHFEELAARLQTQGLRVASFGTPDEYVPGTENRTGGSIEEMCRSMMACSHFVSNDSGPMHLANAFGMPVLAMFAPTDPFTHLPLGTRTEALALEKYCAPCEIKNRRHFASGACRCIGEVSLEEVERSLLALLKGDPSGVEARGPAIAERTS